MLRGKCFTISAYISKEKGQIVIYAFTIRN